jgi:hypothetical protein
MVWQRLAKTQEFVSPQSQQFLRRVSETSGVGKATGLPPGDALLALAVILKYPKRQIATKYHRRLQRAPGAALPAIA